MTYTSPIRRAARHARQEAPTHRFAVGEIVRLKGGFRSSALPADIYQITATLPAMGDIPQYRIRNDDERHERMTTQDSLEPVGIPRTGGSATLIERTFGHGQGTETQQPRDQEAEAGESRPEA